MKEHARVVVIGGGIVGAAVLSTFHRKMMNATMTIAPSTNGALRVLASDPRYALSNPMPPTVRWNDFRQSVLLECRAQARIFILAQHVEAERRAICPATDLDLQVCQDLKDAPFPLN